MKPDQRVDKRLKRVFEGAGYRTKYMNWFGWRDMLLVSRPGKSEVVRSIVDYVVCNGPGIRNIWEGAGINPLNLAAAEGMVIPKSLPKLFKDDYSARIEGCVMVIDRKMEKEDFLTETMILMRQKTFVHFVRKHAEIATRIVPRRTLL